MLLGVLVVTIGAVVLAWAVTRTWSFLPHAPSDFWALGVLALVAEAPLFVFARRRAGPDRTTVSVVGTFAILLVWGPGPAIVVQAVATGVRSLGQRLPAWQAALLGGRLVCALGAAEVVFLLLGGVSRPVPNISEAALHFVLPAAAWCAVCFGLVAVGLASLGERAPGQVSVGLREDFLSTTAALMLAFPLLPALTRFGWWTVLFLAPLLAWNQLSRETYGREEVLHREPVTGLLNRRGLAASFENLAAADVVKGESDRSYGVVLVNIDTVEAVNRDLGRDLYETLVAAAGERLVAAFGDNQVGRFVGLGFVVLRPGLRAEDAVPESATVAGILGPPFTVDGILFRLDPVAGTSLSPEHGLDLDTLVARAELAATRARRRGEMAELYVAETAAVVRRRRQLLTEVNAALTDPARHHEIAVLYQPQVEIATGRLAGVEALVRWMNPTWGAVRTDEIIAAAEPTEVMHLLTTHVITRVAAQLAAWNEAGLRVRSAVNVSVFDLYEEGFAERIGQILRAYRLSPEQLTIEVTETAVTTDPDRVVRSAQRLRALGVGLSLDDFGTGYASLQQLRMLPLTEVKVDRSYVTAMTTGRAEHAIVTSVHQFARSLDLVLVVEGVEDEPTAAALARLPGIIGQGYYFGKPMAPDELRHAASVRAWPGQPRWLRPGRPARLDRDRRRLRPPRRAA
jgi:EAL domain-containing protein (putative c-di-GMP-specific phosphodiesterase class I)/GGDEF domain-containing protein